MIGYFGRIQKDSGTQRLQARKTILEVYVRVFLLNYPELIRLLIITCQPVGSIKTCLVVMFSYKNDVEL